MARPERNNVDYFPFLCKEGKSMYYIEERYGNDGFATWIKILRQLAVTDYHYLNLFSKIELMFLASKCKISEDVLIAIINDLCELGEFDRELWAENRILFSEKFINHISDAYMKRNNKCITLEGLLHLLDSLGVRKLGKFPLKDPVNPQSKEEYTKEKKTKVEYTPTFEENFDSAFDEITLENYKMVFKGVDIQQELNHFRLKCNNDQASYHSRDPSSLRTAFQYQLKQAKPKKSLKPLHDLK